MPLGDRRCPCSKWLPLLAEKTSAVLFLAWVPQLHPQDKTWFGNLDSLDPPLEYLDPTPVKHKISHSQIIFILLENFRIHFGNSSENVTWICMSQNFVAFISFQMFNVSKFPTGVDFLGTALEFRKRMKNLLLLVYSCMCSPECEIKHFHVVVVQWQQRNVQWKAPRSKLMDELNWKRAWPPVWGTRKKCRTSDFSLAHRNYRTLQRLSIIKMQMCHGEEIYFFKTNSTVSIHSPMHMMLESLENLTLWMAQSCFRPSFIGLWKKNIANGKEACQDDQVQQCKYVCSDVCYFVKKIGVFSWAKPLQFLPVDFHLFYCVLQ